MDRTDLETHVAAFADLDASTLYDILRLRGDVFVVEQACVFADIDGRDREPEARHLWMTAGGEVVAYARLLTLAGDEPATELGRIVTPLAHRGTGLGRHLVVTAMALIDGPIVLKAQARLADFYGSLGFVVTGEAFLEDDILHVPMRHAPS